MQVLEWWCKQPQYSTDAICARRAAAAAVKAGKPLPALTREPKNSGALGVKGTPAQRRLAMLKTMQRRVKTFCEVPEHKATKACVMMASRALCEREPKACPPRAAAKLKSPRTAAAEWPAAAAAESRWQSGAVEQFSAAVRKK